MDNNVLKFERKEEAVYYVDEMISFHNAVLASINVLFNAYTDSSKLNNGDIVKAKLVFFKELINVKRKTLEDFNHHVMESLNMMFLENSEFENIQILRQHVENMQVGIKRGQDELFTHSAMIDDFIRLNYPPKEG